MQKTWVQSLGREDPLEKEMGTHSSILTWGIEWREEPGSLQSMGSPESDTTEWLKNNIIMVNSFITARNKFWESTGKNSYWSFLAQLKIYLLNGDFWTYLYKIKCSLICTPIYTDQWYHITSANVGAEWRQEPGNSLLLSQYLAQFLPTLVLVTLAQGMTTHTGTCSLPHYILHTMCTKRRTLIFRKKANNFYDY